MFLGETLPWVHIITPSPPSHTQKRTHTHTHTRTHARTHARTHTNLVLSLAEKGKKKLYLLTYTLFNSYYIHTLPLLKYALPKYIFSS